VFLAAAFLSHGAPERIVLAVLGESDPRAFEISEETIGWRNHRIGISSLREIRRDFAISFGSCSFREPVDELTALVSEHA
jgi:hypothetical protein